MTTDVVPVEVVDEQRRKAALLRAIGLDKVPAEQREIAVAIANKYELDLLLKHLVLVEGRPYITRDGLLWIAHRSGVLDGIEVDEPEIVGKYWHAVCRVYRKDMSRAFQYSGRYPVDGKNRAYGPEMAIKVAESMALRRAFNVSAPTVDERWDLSTVQADVDAVSTPQQSPRTLAERVAERRPTGPPPDEDPEVTQAYGVRRMQDEAEAPPSDLVEGIEDELACGDEDVSPMALGLCDLPPDHKGAHRSENGTWPR